MSTSPQHPECSMATFGPRSGAPLNQCPMRPSVFRFALKRVKRAEIRKGMVMIHPALKPVRQALAHCSSKLLAAISAHNRARARANACLDHDQGVEETAEVRH